MIWGNSATGSMAMRRGNGSNGRCSDGTLLLEEALGTAENTRGWGCTGKTHTAVPSGLFSPVAGWPSAVDGRVCGCKRTLVDLKGQ